MLKFLKSDNLTANQVSSFSSSGFDESKSERVLLELLEKTVKPIVKRIVNLKVRDYPDEQEEVANEVILQLIAFLQSSDFNQKVHSIKDFEAYAATAAYHACNRFISRQHPNRRWLKNGLRYLLCQRAEFALWQTVKTKWLGGFSAWRGQAAGVINGELRDNPKLFRRRSLTPNLTQSGVTLILLRDLLEWSKSPLELEVIVNVLADAQGITDQIVELDDERSIPAKTLYAPHADVENELTNRFYLRRLWKEIQALPAFQRKALLLNLRDENGESIMDLFVLTKTTTFEEIAAVLGLPIDEFAALWNALPIDDLQISRMLSLTRQQIINLRKAARDRLGRRMKSF